MSVRGELIILLNIWDSGRTGNDFRKSRMLRKNKLKLFNVLLVGLFLLQPTIAAPQDTLSITEPSQVSSFPGGPVPSDEVFARFFKDAISDDLVFSDNNFEILKIERVNGWPSGDEYVVDGRGLFRSRVDYINILTDMFRYVVFQMRSNVFLGLSLTAESGLRQDSNEALALFEFLEKKYNEDSLPQDLLSYMGAMEEGEFLTALETADFILRENYYDFFDRSLVPGYETIGTFELKFRKTERGWVGVKK